MTPDRTRRRRVPWFELKVVGILVAAALVTGLAAVYLFNLGVTAAFNPVLQPSIAAALETAKDRTRDHIETLREQLKMRTERIASEIRRRGPPARLPGQLEPFLRQLADEDQRAFERTPANGTSESLEPRLVSVSAVDAAGRRITVLRPGDYPDAVWRLKTFRPRPPGTAPAIRAAASDALASPLLCALGACAAAPDRLLATADLFGRLARIGDGREAPADLDAAGLEVTYATPWALFDSLQKLGDVLDNYKILRQGAQDIRRRFSWVYMILLGVALLFTLGVAAVFARRTSRRVAVIARATRTVAAGDLEVRIAAAGRDEVAELARSFNEMVSDLRESRDRIAYLGRVSAWQGIARRLAHEIKNPLTPIQLAIQEVAEKYDGSDPKYSRLVQTAREVIEEEVATLRRLTSEFSEFARLPRVEPQPVELFEFVDDCSAAFGSAGVDRGVEIVWTRPKRSAGVLIDRQMMRRVVDNLVRNAVDAAASVPAGEGAPVRRVEVSAEIDRDRREAVISVADTGPGIAAEARDHLFEPYFTTKANGTGLGLAIVKKIVLEHGGEVTVETSEKGTTFRVSMPLAGEGEARPDGDGA